MNKIKKSWMYSLARSIYWFVINKLIFENILYVYGKYKYRKCLLESSRSQTHTYTSFYRSPGQLDALKGPVLDYLRGSNKGKPLSIAIFAGSNGAEAYTLVSTLLMHDPSLKFSIICSDLHQENIDKAQNGIYLLNELAKGLNIPESFINFTFDKVESGYRVKDNIRKHVNFIQCDLLDKGLSSKFDVYDIIFVQNVLFHLDDDAAVTVFKSLMNLMKDKAVIFIDGMQLDIREKLTSEYNLEPLNYKVGEIYNYSRLHIPRDWWNYYYGSEPYTFFNQWNARRYCTIFLLGAHK